MKRTLLLLAIMIVQALFCSLYACESQSDSTAKSVSSPSLASALQSENCQKEAANAEHQLCSLCSVCHHLFVPLFIPKIDFESNDFLTSPITYEFSYQSPFISFSPKPPIRA